jgi:hypothetical protein
MKIQKAVLASIAVQLGFKTAKTWDLDKAKAKAEQIPGQVDEDTKLADPAEQKLLAPLVEAIKAGTLEIVDDAAAAPAAEAAPKKATKPPIEDEDDKPAPVAAATETAAPKKKTAKAKPAAAAADADEVEEATKKPAEPKEAAPKKATKKAAAPKEPAAPRTRMGVTQARARPYLAGIIIKKAVKAAGLTMKEIAKVGVTQAMVQELDASYGKANPNESLFCLRNAWHAIRGAVTADNEGELTMAAPKE